MYISLSNQNCCLYIPCLDIIYAKQCCSIIMIFVLMPVYHAFMGWMVFLERLPSVSAFPFFQVTLINSFHVFHVPYSQDWTISSILSRWPDYLCFLSGKHSLMLLSFGLFLSSIEVLFWGLMFRINLMVLASFLSSLITESCWTGQVSLPYEINAKYIFGI